MATLARIAKENGKAMPQGKLIAYKRNGRGQIKALFSPRYWRTTLLLWFLWFVNTISYYGIILLTTELFQAGPSCESVLIMLLVIDRIGRKKSMALTFFVFFLSILPIYACIGRTAVTICLFIGRASMAGGFQVVFVYTSEVFPTENRALAMGTSNMMSKVGALIVPFVAQVLLRTSVYGTLSLFCGFSLLGGIAALILPIETLGRGLQKSSLYEEDGDQTTAATTRESNDANAGEPEVIQDE